VELIKSSIKVEELNDFDLSSVYDICKKKYSNKLSQKSSGAALAQKQWKSFLSSTEVEELNDFDLSSPCDLCKNY